MSEDINVTDGTVLEALNNKVDLDGGNYKGSELETYIHDHCTADRANLDLSNLSETGETHFLNKTQITNCLLEVPEKIKYTLLNGVLTLKAGSELVIPNGFETNGTTRKFNKVILNKDITFAYGGKAENLVVCATASGQFFSTIIDYAVSNTDEPTVGANRVIWFDSTNNIVKTKTTGNDWISNLSFPLFIVDLDSSAKVTNLKNVFNGFGVIGHHTFSYDGIKSLIPNGKNADGTLKNIEKITTSINVRDEAGRGSWLCFWDGTNLLTYGVNNYFEQDTQPTFSGQHCMWFNTKENLMHTTSDSGATWTVQPRMYLGVLRKNSSSGDFKEASFKTPVELVKMDDLDRAFDNLEKNLVEVDITNMIMPDYTAGVSISSGYVAQQNGWIAWQVGTTKRATTTVLVDGITVEGAYMDDSHQIYGLTPIAKGSTFTNSGGELAYAIFYPCKGV